MMHVHQAGSGVSMSASGLVGVAGGKILQKIACGASTAAIIRVRDGTTVSGTIILDSFPLTAGQVYELNLALATGCFIELVSGTGTWTAVHL